jgi:hypothetical protein
MARQPQIDDVDLFSEVYIDETSQTKHRYLVLGGIIVPRRFSADFEDRIQRARLSELPHGEMAWTKVSRTKLPAYRRVINVFFNAPFAYDHLDFHSLVVDSHRVDDRRFNEGSREIGFNKEIYQLCRKFGRLYPDRLFHIYADRRNTSQPPNETRLILNRGILRSGDTRDWPYRRLHFRDSDKSQVLQLVDVLLGAIAFRLNGHYNAQGASPAKRDLCDHIISRAHIRDVFCDTATRGRFTIWHRRLR